MTQVLWASQRVQVDLPDAAVLEKPDLSYVPFCYLKKGAKIQASSQFILDSSGVSWYRVRTTEGKLGYMRGAHLKLLLQASQSESKLNRGLASSSSQPLVWDEEPAYKAHPAFLRIMQTLRTDLIQGGFGLGYEFEFAYEVPIVDEGASFNRTLALGLTYVDWSTSQRAVLASFIMRLWQGRYLQPEARIRFGPSLINPALLLGGVNLGLRIFLAGASLNNSAPFFSLYAELATLSEASNYTLQASFSGGAAVQF